MELRRCDQCGADIVNGEFYIALKFVTFYATIGDDGKEKHFESWECVSIYAARKAKTNGN